MGRRELLAGCQCRELGCADTFQTLEDRGLRAGDRVRGAAEPVLVAARAQEGLDLEGDLRSPASRSICLTGVPLGPELMHRWGELVRPLLFRRSAVDR